MAQSNEGIGCITTFIAAALVWGFFHYTDFDFLSGDQLTDYQLQCGTNLANGRCPEGSWKRLAKTRYTLNRDQQFVVGQIDDFPPVKYAACAIVDKDNWKCDVDGRYGHSSFGYVSGHYWVAGEGTNTDNQYYRHVSRWDWFVANAPTNK